MLETVVYPAEPPSKKLAAILGRRAGIAAEVDEAVREVLREVRVRGDEAVAEFTHRFDGVEIAAHQTKHLLLGRDCIGASRTDNFIYRTKGLRPVRHSCHRLCSPHSIYLINT